MRSPFNIGLDIMVATCHNGGVIEEMPLRRTAGGPSCTYKATRWRYGTMSRNRKRRTRRTRLVRTAGAGVRRNVTVSDAPKASGPAFTPGTGMFRDGQGKAQPHKPQKVGMWARHDVDMTQHLHGKRLATRSTSGAWGGHWLAMRTWERGSFIRGKGLARKPLAYALYVQGKRVGWCADPQYGIAWQRAATGQDLDTSLIQE